MLQSYKQLQEKHKGQVAFILGAGTSLLGLDVAPLADHVVVSVNSSILVLPWEQGDPSKRYWISNDALCRRWTYWDKVKSSKATKIVRNSWEKYYPEIPDFLYFWPRSTPEDTIDPDGDGLCYCSSVPTAIDLSIFMGCNTIFLLGVDQYILGTRSHFWDMWPTAMQPKMKGLKSSPPAQKLVFNINNKAYEALEKYAISKKVEIFNCNQQSRVTAFPKISYSDAFKIIDAKNKVKK